MRSLLLLLGVVINLTAICQGKNSFPFLRFNKVAMYDYESDGEKGGDVVTSDGELINTIRKTVVLTKANVDLLTKKLSQKKSFGGGTAACFEPHLGFVYYLNQKIVGHISVCFGCNRFSSSKGLPAQQQGKVGKGKEAYYLADGMSKEFRKFLNGWLIQYNFSHQIMAGASYFDE